MHKAVEVVDTGHTDIVHDARANFYGQIIATCSSDHSIRIWDKFRKTPPGLSLVKELKGHGGPVWGVDWSHPMHGNLLASCSYDRTVRIWKNESENLWSCVHVYEGHDASVDCVAFAPWIFGLVLASGCAHGSISVIRQQLDKSGSEFGGMNGTLFKACLIPNAHEMGVNAIAWCANHYLPGGCDRPKRFASAGSDGLVKVWKCLVGFEDWAVESVLLNGHDDWVRDLKWIYPTPLMKRIRIVSVGQDKRLVIWEMTDDDQATFAKTQTIVFEDVLWSVDALPHENVLVVTGRDNKIHIVHENEGSFVRILDTAMDADIQLSDLPQAGDNPEDDRENHHA